MARKRMYRKKKNFGGRYGKYFNTAEKALKLALATKRILNVETKYHDVVDVAGNTVTSTGTVVNLSQIAQGDTQNTRDGSSCKPHNMTFKGQLFFNASAAQTSLRLVLCKGNNENGTTPTIATFFETSHYLAQKNFNNRFQTKVLWDRTFTLSTGSTGNINFSKNFKLDGHITFSGATTTIESGGYYLLLISNEPTNAPQFLYNIRTMYYDN